MIVRWGLEEYPGLLAELGVDRPLLVTTKRWTTVDLPAYRRISQKAASASTAQERGEAMQAQWETATIPLGAEAAGLSEPQYRDVRDGVNRVFTTLDFQGKIDGPLSIDLERADPETKARVSGDAFAGLAPEAAMALRARMDRLVPLWSEYKKLVAVAG